MFSESIYTVEEVARHLRVDVEVINAEINKGQLKALHIGESMRIQETALNAYKNQVLSSLAGNHHHLVHVDLESTADFTHTWPDKSTETYTSVRKGVVQHDGQDYDIKVGFTNRKSAGKLRTRSLVLVNRYPTVEFVASDTGVMLGLMASIIKDRRGKHLPAMAVPPSEYTEIPVGPYRNVVDGPGASNGLAVICHPDDLETMVRHALIRHTYREARKYQELAITGGYSPETSA